jgi:hypothetical protein
MQAQSNETVFEGGWRRGAPFARFGHNLAKVGCRGSSPFASSNDFRKLGDSSAGVFSRAVTYS